MVLLFAAFCYAGDIRPSWMYSTDTFGGKVVQWGFVQNDWISVHFMGGSVLARGLNNPYVGVSPKTTFWIVSAIGIGWEIFQAWPSEENRVLRQSEQYWFNSTADAVAVSLGALLVLRDFGPINLSVKDNQLNIEWSF